MKQHVRENLHCTRTGTNKRGHSSFVYEQADGHVWWMIKIRTCGSKVTTVLDVIEKCKSCGSICTSGAVLRINTVGWEGSQRQYRAPS